MLEHESFLVARAMTRNLQLHVRPWLAIACVLAHEDWQTKMLGHNMM